MKKLNTPFFTIATVVFLIALCSCKKENPQLGTPPSDAEKWENIENKFEKYFSEKPGK